MNALQLAHLLQLTDSLFPVGAFAYSDGLETAAVSGKVCDGASLRIWIDHYLNHVFVPCDGLAFLQCTDAVSIQNFELIQTIDEELTAIRPASAVRNSSRVIGKRLAATYSGISGAEIAPLPQCNAAVAYAMALTHRGIDARSGLLAFGYTRVAGIISASLRLIPLGQQQAQQILSDSLEFLPAIIDQIFENRLEPLRSFSPLMDIQQMNHQYVYSRMFRS